MFKTYYRLLKPGIIYGNLVTAAAGFFFASRGHINFVLLLATLLGLGLVIGSACAFNNYLDRGIDAKMARTKKRALVTGAISARAALTYATLVGATGTAILALFTNPLTVAVALTGWFFYVVVYSLAKRRTVHGTLVGTISGATPPVIGYTAVTGHLGAAAALLFFILVAWQMPHFYAIAIYRLKDYQSAGIPVLPAVRGIRAAKIQILAYTIGFASLAVLLGLAGYAGWLYLTVAGLISAAWIWLYLKGFNEPDSTAWAKRLFAFSLVVLTILSFAMSISYGTRPLS